MVLTEMRLVGDVQATVRFGAGSVNLVRLGSGDAGRLGASW